MAHEVHPDVGQTIARAQTQSFDNVRFSLFGTADVYFAKANEGVSSGQIPI
jgi:hypothetical protein